MLFQDLLKKDMDTFFNLSTCFYEENDKLIISHKIQRKMFSVATYNILADCYVRVPNQEWNAFSNVSDEDLDWNNRQYKIITKLLESTVDIICLQEVMFEIISGEWSIPKWLDCLSEYTGVMQCTSQKDITKNSKRNLKMVGKAIPTGVVTFYRTSKFKEYEKSKHGSGSGLTLFLDMDGNKFSISNIHLVGNPLNFDSHESQLGGTFKVSSENSIICGDFNQDISGCDIPAKIKDILISNSYIRVDTSESYYDTCKMKIDHILFRGNLISLPVKSCLDHPLPNSNEPSDHIMIIALFNFQ